MKLIICEKPSVAKSIVSALGASSRADGFYEGSGLLVGWALPKCRSFCRNGSRSLPRTIWKPASASGRPGAASM